MEIVITLLTIVLVLNCLLLILLVLIQLPKKEAGAGLAFGGGATDALFGSGSGNALTKLTKYAGGTFLLLSLFLGVLNSRAAHSSTSRLREELANQQKMAPSATPAAAPKPASQFQPLTPSTNLLTPSAPTTAPAAATTNSALPK